MEFSEDGEVHVFATADPYWHYISGGHSGRNILDPMFKEKWHLSYTGYSVLFSNKTYFVSATQENSDRPPVEAHRSTGDRWR